MALAHVYSSVGWLSLWLQGVVVDGVFVFASTPVAACELPGRPRPPSSWRLGPVMPPCPLIGDACRVSPPWPVAGGLEIPAPSALGACLTAPSLLIIISNGRRPPRRSRPPSSWRPSWCSPRSAARSGRRATPFSLSLVIAGPRAAQLSLPTGCPATRCMLPTRGTLCHALLCHARVIATSSPPRAAADLPALRPEGTI